MGCLYSYHFNLLTLCSRGPPQPFSGSECPESLFLEQFHEQIFPSKEKVQVPPRRKYHLQLGTALSFQLHPSTLVATRVYRLMLPTCLASVRSVHSAAHLVSFCMFVLICMDLKQWKLQPHPTFRKMDRISDVDKS